MEVPVHKGWIGNEAMTEKCPDCLAHHSNGKNHKCNLFMRLLVSEARKRKSRAKREQKTPRIHA